MRQLKMSLSLAVKGITPLFLKIIKLGMLTASVSLLAAVIFLLFPKDTVYEFVIYTLLFKEGLRISVLCLFLSLASGLMIDAYIRKLDNRE